MTYQSPGWRRSFARKASSGSLLGSRLLGRLGGGPGSLVRLFAGSGLAGSGGDGGFVGVGLDRSIGVVGRVRFCNDGSRHLCGAGLGNLLLGFQIRIVFGIPGLEFLVGHLASCFLLQLC